MKLRIFLFIFCYSLVAKAQDPSMHDSTTIPYYKNTIRWNLTPTLVLGTGSWVFGYERLLKNKNSFSTNIGFIQMPRFAETLFDSLEIQTGAKRNGVSFAFDYRFYIKSRNKFAPPDGLYWGPYLTNYYFNSETQIIIADDDIIKSDFVTRSKINLLMIGVQLGYQFVLGEKKRWTVDLVLVGPSIRHNYLNIDFTANGEINPNNEYVQGVHNTLLAFFPGLKELAMEGSLTSSGFSSSFGMGYRYLIQVGYRF